MSATSISTADAKTSAQSIFENLDKLEARERMVGQLTPIQGIFRGHRCGRSAGIPELMQKLNQALEKESYRIDINEISSILFLLAKAIGERFGSLESLDKQSNNLSDALQACEDAMIASKILMFFSDHRRVGFSEFRHRNQTLLIEHVLQGHLPRFMPYSQSMVDFIVHCLDWLSSPNNFRGEEFTVVNKNLITRIRCFLENIPSNLSCGNTFRFPRYWEKGEPKSDSERHLTHIRPAILSLLAASLVNLAKYDNQGFRYLVEWRIYEAVPALFNVIFETLIDRRPEKPSLIELESRLLEQHPDGIAKHSLALPISQERPAELLLRARVWLRLSGITRHPTASLAEKRKWRKINHKAGFLENEKPAELFYTNRLFNNCSDKFFPL